MDIYEEIVKLQREGHKGAVATIVNVRGSIHRSRAPRCWCAKTAPSPAPSAAAVLKPRYGRPRAKSWPAKSRARLTFDLNQDPKYDTGLVCGGTLEIFIEPVLPTPLLYIFGAGHVGLRARQSRRAAPGSKSLWCDDRDAYANRERFPDAREVIAKDYDERSPA